MVFIEVPQYDELSVKNLWPQFADDEEVTKYFPDSFRTGKDHVENIFSMW